MVASVRSEGHQIGTLLKYIHYLSSSESVVHAICLENVFIYDKICKSYGFCLINEILDFTNMLL